MIVGTVRAAALPLSAAEVIRADAVNSTTDVKARMRHRPGITSAMQALHGADTCRITSVIDVKSARCELELLCKRAA